VADAGAGVGVGVDAGVDVGRGDLTDSRAIALFLDMCAAERGSAKNTILAYRADLDGASASLGGRLAAATGDDLARLLHDWRDLARASLQRKVSALRGFFAFQVREGLRRDDPTATLPGSRGPAPCRSHWRSVTSIDCSPRWRTGCRRGRPCVCAR